jgi:hypothetical protein
LNSNKYEIEKSSVKVSDLDILTALFLHLYRSNMKLKAVIIGVVAGNVAIIGSGILY